MVTLTVHEVFSLFKDQQLCFFLLNAILEAIRGSKGSVWTGQSLGLSLSRWATISQNEHVKNPHSFLNKSRIASEKHTDLVHRPVQSIKRSAAAQLRPQGSKCLL